MCCYLSLVAQSPSYSVCCYLPLIATCVWYCVLLYLFYSDITMTITLTVYFILTVLVAIYHVIYHNVIHIILYVLLSFSGSAKSILHRLLLYHIISYQYHIPQCIFWCIPFSWLKMLLASRTCTFDNERARHRWRADRC